MAGFHPGETRLTITGDDYGLRVEPHTSTVILAPHLPAALRDLTLAVRLLGRRVEVRFRG
jgi:hypothetical protein